MLCCYSCGPINEELDTFDGDRQMARTSIWLSVSPAAMLLVGCANSPQSGNCAAGNDQAASSRLAAPTSNDAVAIADARLARQHFRRYGPPDVIDMGDRWRLLYPDGGGTGGLILVVVNKRSGEIVHMETQQ